jgi:hypothetical protein
VKTPTFSVEVITLPGFAPEIDPARGDCASFANFSDPDGNIWVLQERGYRKE